MNVTVRDKNGNLVRDLKPEDFTVLEDNKPQKIVDLRYREHRERAAGADAAQATC